MRPCLKGTAAPFSSSRPRRPHRGGPQACRPGGGAGFPGLGLGASSGPGDPALKGKPWPSRPCAAASAAPATPGLRTGRFIWRAAGRPETAAAASQASAPATPSSEAACRLGQPRGGRGGGGGGGRRRWGGRGGARGGGRRGGGLDRWLRHRQLRQPRSLAEGCISSAPRATGASAKAFWEAEEGGLQWSHWGARGQL